MNIRRTLGFREFSLAAGILLSFRVALGQAELMPMRAFRVEGGIVSVRGGVMRDPSRPAAPFGKMRYPSVHFVVMENESPTAFWAEVALRPPDQKKEKKAFWGPLPTGKEGIWRWSTSDAVFGQLIPVRISVYGDEARTKKLGEQEMTMYFGEEEQAAFHQPPERKEGSVAVVAISGWREMGASLCSVEGSVADAELRWDVCRSIWENESLDHLNCEHRFTGVEKLPAAESKLLAAQTEDFRARAEAFLSKGDLTLEKWSVKSCDVVTPYEVMLIKSPQGGTDIMTAPMRP